MTEERKCKWWKKGGKGNMRYILPVRASHFRYVSKTISIP
jgi:hypothetical protein